jgi:hypothetical protein
MHIVILNGCSEAGSLFLQPRAAASRRATSAFSYLYGVHAHHGTALPPYCVLWRGPDLGDPATHPRFRDIILHSRHFSTFKGPQYALTPSKTAPTTAPTQLLVRCILKLPQHTPSGSTLWQRSRCSRWHASHRGRWYGCRPRPLLLHLPPRCMAAAH